MLSFCGCCHPCSLYSFNSCKNKISRSFATFGRNRPNYDIKVYNYLMNIKCKREIIFNIWLMDIRENTKKKCLPGIFLQLISICKSVLRSHNFFGVFTLLSYNKLMFYFRSETSYNFLFKLNIIIVIVCLCMYVYKCRYITHYCSQ